MTRDEAGDVEALASACCPCGHKISEHPHPFPGNAYCECRRSPQDALLASDWLAARDAEQRRLGAGVGRRATLDPGAFVKRGPDYDGNEYGERLDHWQARAIEEGLARAAAQQVSER